MANNVLTFLSSSKPNEHRVANNKTQKKPFELRKKTCANKENSNSLYVPKYCSPAPYKLGSELASEAKKYVP